MKIVVLCDFDGTTVNIDTAEYTLEKLAEGNWKTLDERLDSGEMPLEECMRQQFMMVKASRKRIVDALDIVVQVRPGFEDLVEHCRSKDIPLTIASAGLDFYIRHFLSQRGLQGKVGLVVPRVSVTRNGLRFAFPELRDPSSVSFKDDLVRHYKKQGKTVVYVGDGTTDFNAARIADLPFAVIGSKLAVLLSKHGIPHNEFMDFRDIVEALKNLERQAEMPGQ
ncbi:MAG: HAD-IB family phosphatase [Methanomassiliicoccales archaeon]|jgi:2-hydroxy-3-keto-5-methylthiopentenyl-1-phosphate phosphatase